MNQLIILICLAALLNSCVSPAVIEALANNSSIIGVTGFFIEMSITPEIENGTYFPVPKLKGGYGTFWRVGKHDKVTINIGSSSGIETKGGSDTKMQLIPKLDGRASLYIHAENFEPKVRDIK